MKTGNNQTTFQSKLIFLEIYFPIAFEFNLPIVITEISNCMTDAGSDTATVINKEGKRIYIEIGLQMMCSQATHQHRDGRFRIDH